MPLKIATMKKVGTGKRRNPKRARAKSRVFAVEVSPSRTDRGYRLTIRAMTARTAKEEARRYCAKQQGAPLSQFKLPRVKVTAIGEMAGGKRSGNPSVPVQEVPRRRLVAELRKLGFTGVRGMSDAKLRLVLMQLGHLTVKRKR